MLKEMYKVLIVDDEPTIAEGIRFMIERGFPEGEVVDIAYDGAEGYEAAIGKRPDIILTDIRMAGIDGLEMIDMLKQAGYNGKFIILSGYADFEYAQRGIRLGIESYITKPIDERELYKTLTEVCGNLEIEQIKNEKVQELEQTVECFGQDMKEYILKEIIFLPEEFTFEKQMQLKQLGFPLSWKNYVCVIIEASKEENVQTKLSFYSVSRQCAEIELRTEWTMEFIRCSDIQTAVIVTSNNYISSADLVNRMSMLRNKIAKKLNICVGIGIGQIQSDFKKIGESFEEARIALNYRVIKGNERVIAYEYIKNMNSEVTKIPQEIIEHLQDSVEKMDNLGCSAVVEEFFDSLLPEQELHPNDLQLLSLNLILSGIQKMPFMQFQLNEYLGKNILSLDSISKFQTIDQLKNWIINILNGMNDLMLNQMMPEKHDVVEEAKTYILRNFQKDISLADISEKFFINPYYFSHLFKKRTGQTYQSYLTNLRIERAKKLLIETDLKVYKVGEMVGYPNSNYFSKIFERQVGVKPTDYKKL